MRRRAAGLMVFVLVVYWVVSVNARSQGPTAVFYLMPVRVSLDADGFLARQTAVSTATDLLLAKTGPAAAAPDQIIAYQIRLDNTTTMTQTMALTDTLPAGLTLLADSLDGGLMFDAPTRRLTWQGMVGPGAPGYLVTELSSPAYINLGDRPAAPADLCTVVADCDEATAVFDLGAMGESVTLFGETVSTLHVSTNGFVLGPQGVSGVACLACPQHLPQEAEPNWLIAGLWRDVDMSGGHGQWYAAIITGFLANPDDAVFYVNWHDAAHFGDPFLTTRHAVAIVLDGQSEPAGRIYVLIDHISDRAALTNAGFVIGVEDKAGLVGTTVAYAPCLEAPCIVQGAQGEAPADGTVLRFDPAVVPGANGRLFAYQARVTAPVGTLLQNQVRASGDGGVETAVVQTLVTYRTYLPWMAKQAPLAAAPLHQK